jgi:rod shape-determining protein MreD
MASLFKRIKLKLLNLIPLFLLFFIALDGSSVIDFKFFSINIHYILVYFWVLKQPRTLGYGYIFISGIITDVVFGLPMGISALTLLIIAAIATYVRLVSVNVSLVTDWLSFIPALIIANFIYFTLLFFLNYSVDYLYLLKNSIFTFISYPVLWLFFKALISLGKGKFYA